MGGETRGWGNVCKREELQFWYNSIQQGVGQEGEARVFFFFSFFLSFFSSFFFMLMFSYNKN